VRLTSCLCIVLLRVVLMWCGCGCVLVLGACVPVCVCACVCMRVALPQPTSGDGGLRATQLAQKVLEKIATGNFTGPMPDLSKLAALKKRIQRDHEANEAEAWRRPGLQAAVELLAAITGAEAAVQRIKAAESESKTSTAESDSKEQDTKPKPKAKKKKKAPPLMWDANRLGPEIQLSQNNRRVTRTTSSRWGTQLGSYYMSSGVHTVELFMEQNESNCLYVGRCRGKCWYAAHKCGDTFCFLFVWPAMRVWFRNRTTST